MMQLQSQLFIEQLSLDRFLGYQITKCVSCSKLCIRPLNSQSCRPIKNH